MDGTIETRCKTSREGGTVNALGKETEVYSCPSLKDRRRQETPATKNGNKPKRWAKENYWEPSTEYSQLKLDLSRTISQCPWRRCLVFERFAAKCDCLGSVQFLRFHHRINWKHFSGALVSVSVPGEDKVSFGQETNHTLPPLQLESHVRTIGTDEQKKLRWRVHTPRMNA